MKKKSLRGKRFLALLLAAAVIVSLMDIPSLTAQAETAAQAEDVSEEVTQAETPTTETVEEEWIDGGEFHYEEKLETSVPSGIQTFSLENGIVDLTAGNHEKWIDRIDVPAELRAVYDRLAEGTDNDGVDDFLIADDGFRSDDGSMSPFRLSVETIEFKVNNDSGNEAEEKVQKYSTYLFAVYNAFDRDYPEVFWLGNGCKTGCTIQYRRDGDGYLYKVNVFLELSRTQKYPDEAAIRAAIAERDENIDRILEGTSGKNNYEMIRYFNEVLTKQNQYNTVISGDGSSNNVDTDCWECVSALAGRMGENGPVCEGYARAFQVLCKKKGIPCTLVDGNADGGAHMWNYVKLDGAWYGVDVTWNDPVVGSDKPQPESGYESESWLLLGGSTVVNGKPFLNSHPVTNQVSQNGVSFINGPVLSETDYTYKDMETVVLGAESYLEGNPESAFTYGDSITVKTTVRYPDGDSGISAQADMQEPTGRQIALYWGDTQISEPVAAPDSGEYALTYTTLDRVVPIGEQILTVRFVGDGELGGTSQNVTVTLKPAEPILKVPENPSFYYGEEVKVPSSEATLFGSEELSYTYTYCKEGESVYTAEVPRNSGIYRVKVSVAADPNGGFWSAAEKEFSLTIQKRPVKILVSDRSKIYGAEDPVLSYTIDAATPLAVGDSLKGELIREEGENAGVYAITQGSLTEENNPNYQISCENGTFTIQPAVYRTEAEPSQTILAGTGAFKEPVFIGVHNEKISGTITYQYEGKTYTYAELVSELGTKAVGSTGSIQAGFVPDANPNYDTTAKVVQIDFTISDIQFYVGDQAASEANAVVKKENAVYGDSWDQIIQIREGLSARIDGISDDQKEHFTLSVSGYPAAGTDLAYEVLYNGTIGGKTCTDMVVCSGTVDVAKRLLAWDTNSLSASDSLLRIEDGKATLTGSLLVSGVLVQDLRRVSFNCPSDRLIGSYVQVASGNQSVRLDWSGEAVALQGEAAGNYRLPVDLPEITGKINPAEREEVTGLPEDRYQLEIETGLSYVPDALRNDVNLNTVAKIEAKLCWCLNIQEGTSSIPAANMAVYDVALMVSTDGLTWTEATAENFPSEGILVTLPYPAGTGKDTHIFTVVHMFTTDREGFEPGDVEYPTVEKTDAGIRFRVYSLSPIALGWQSIASNPTSGTTAASQPTASQTGTTNPTQAAGTQNPTQAAGTQNPAQVAGTQTGDSNPILYFYLLLLLAVGTIVCLLVEKKQARRR